MQMPVEGKCLLDSCLHEPRIGMETGNCVWHNRYHSAY
jgi:hypothetical protein